MHISQNVKSPITCYINTFKPTVFVKICKITTFVIINSGHYFWKSGIIFMEIVKFQKKRPPVIIL